MALEGEAAVPVVVRRDIQLRHGDAQAVEKPRRQPHDQKRRARRLYEDGWTQGEIAEALGVSERTVWRWVG
jgi:Response regulator containing a CheY-like receiver domain and an HTH DNA-binding domain